MTVPGHQFLAPVPIRLACPRFVYHALGEFRLVGQITLCGRVERWGQPHQMANEMLSAWQFSGDDNGL
jgi:hypothetical protein